MQSSDPKKYKKLLLVLLKAAISGSLLYYVISKTGLGKIASTLGGINIGSFLVAVVLYLFAIYLSSIRWGLLMSDRPRKKQLFSLYLIGSFFNIFLPGTIGGDAVKAYYLYKERGNSSAVIASVFMDRYIGFAALAFIGIAAFPFGFSYFRGSFIEWILPLMVLSFISGSFIVFGLRLGQRIRFLSGLYEYFSLYMKKRTVLFKTFLLSLAVQTTGVLAVYTLSKGLNMQLPLLPLFIFIPVISAMTTIPISISGLGVREASFVLLFAYLGLSPSEATALSLSWFLSASTGSLAGLIEYIKYKNRLKSQ
ncbi:MAG: lysylphosphatidylglycerol synthase transmembrane domain-containing protein [Nitrospirota bacterium]